MNCANCNAQAGQPHARQCPRPKYHGDPEPGSPNWRRMRAEKKHIRTLTAPEARAMFRATDRAREAERDA